MIKITNLNKYFNKGKSNEIHVINDTCLEFDHTGLVCILGESGSGKTTLLNTIGGLDTFLKGSIQIDDITLEKYSPNEIEKLRNSKFGYIFQEQYLLQEHTVAYNILLAMNLYDISTEEKETRVDYVLQAVGMKKYKKRLVSQLSGGQQQRIAIARALAKSPDIIFADEPTGNLDEANTMRIMSIIKKISKDCLVILVTHERRIAEFFADRIVSVEDGKVIKDVSHQSQTTYKYSDDSNIYLKEFEKEIYQSSDIDINYYHEGAQSKVTQSNATQSNVTLNMVYRNNKFYIQTPEEANVVFLNSEDEMQVIDGEKPVLELEQMEDFDYDLPRPKADKIPKLPLKEVYKLARENVKSLGKQQAYIMVTLIITSILLVFAVADYMTTASIDKKSMITEDSHYISVRAEVNSTAQIDQSVRRYNEICDELVNSKFKEGIYVDENSALSFSYVGYEQLNYLQHTISDFSYVTLEHCKKKDLICGRMPEKRNEIIIDKWLIDKFYESDSILKPYMSNIRDFLNLEVTTKVMNRSLKIVGICDTGEPSVFIDQYMGLSIEPDTSIASIDQLRDAYPGKYDNVKLAKDEILRRELDENSSIWMGEETVDENGGLAIVGTYPHEFDASYVIADANYEDFLSSFIKQKKSFLIYADNEEEKEAIIKYLKKQETSNLKILISDTNREQLEVYKKMRAVNMNARTIVTMAIFIISIFMLFFTMKSNAIKRAQEITVYRLMGITGKSILLSFVMESFLITSNTVLPVVLAFSCIMKLIAGIPSLQIDIVYPWWAIAGLLAFLYAVNILIGIVSVYRFINLPPAQIAEKA